MPDSNATNLVPESSTRLPLPLHGQQAKTSGRIAAVALGSLFVALCAQVAVPLPWTPVPMTMQPFGVLLVAMLLGPWTGAGAMVAYLLEGLVGLPVFVPGFGGLLPMGPSAGYLLSYPLVALVTGLLFRRLSDRTVQHGFGLFRAVAAAAVGDALILLCGAAWLGLVTRGSLAQIFSLAVLPFLAGDAVKVLLAAAVASGVFRLKRRFDEVDTPTA